MKEAFNFNLDVHFLYLFLVLMNNAILIVLYLFFICNCIINVYEYDICIWNMHLKIRLNFYTFKQHVFEIYIFCNIRNVFTVT